MIEASRQIKVCERRPVFKTLHDEVHDTLEIKSMEIIVDPNSIHIVKLEFVKHPFKFEFQVNNAVFFEKMYLKLHQTVGATLCVFDGATHLAMAGVDGDTIRDDGDAS